MVANGTAQPDLLSHYADGANRPLNGGLISPRPRPTGLDPNPTVGISAVDRGAQLRRIGERNKAAGKSPMPRVVSGKTKALRGGTLNFDDFPTWGWYAIGGAAIIGAVVLMKRGG